MVIFFVCLVQEKALQIDKEGVIGEKYGCSHVSYFKCLM